MKRRTRLLSLGIAAVAAAVVGGYIFAAKFDVREESLALHDASRDRDVPVEISISRRAELKKMFGFKPRVAIVNHGYTVNHNEYKFLANVLATQGYLVASIQHDLPGDAPLSQVGFPFVGRMPMYERGVKNIFFALDEVKRRYPDLDYTKLTMLGHSNGGDISMFFAGHNPEIVTKIVTLDNLRVPFLMSGKSRILSFRSKDWKPDPGVVPTDEMCDDAGIELVKTEFQHVDMSDRGPETVKESIKAKLARFLADDKPAKKPAERKPTDNRLSVNYMPSN
ncbi:serine aminopeptidase domain-containing protein [Bradyrhizobium sp. LHD-71]|uniref:serine aminopeptidase domain-containing protein n=1 Tax=Bradyrhizobium sp. LHD-71 TaxID=3072141 RepID=UPI0028100EBA|nr:alpha/beta hydrolase [Bradyrhizobium sp. LHD-71]MDQ8730817.1 alpha/beta hydrolase [Bradyrhizobium sp. LHD-71]